MPTTTARLPRSLPSPLVRAALLAPLLLLAWTRPAAASFHLMEINKIMAGFEGNTSVQAVELRMLAGGENFVSGGSIAVYDAAGNPVAVLGTFPADLSSTGSVAGARILCATSAFATLFGITPDLVISAGVPVTTGQVSFEKPICFVNSVAYGAVTAVKNGTTAAVPLPTLGATALVRTVNDATLPSCPLAEDAAARFQLTSGSPAAPIVFTNYAGASASVSSTVTAVEASPAPAVFAVEPNPIRSSATIRAPGSARLAVYDVRGRLVRDLSARGGSTSGRVRWNGDDARGGPVPSGVYFLRLEDPSGQRVQRVAVVR